MSVMENEHHCSLQGQVKRSGDIYYWNGWTELWGANQGWGLERGMKCCSWAMSGLLSFFSPQSLRMTSGLHLTFLSFPHMAPAWWVDCILLSCFSPQGPSMTSGLHFTFMFLPKGPQHDEWIAFYFHVSPSQSPQNDEWIAFYFHISPKRVPAWWVDCILLSCFSPQAPIISMRTERPLVTCYPVSPLLRFTKHLEKTGRKQTNKFYASIVHT